MPNLWPIFFNSRWDLATGAPRNISDANSSFNFMPTYLDAVLTTGFSMCLTGLITASATGGRDPKPGMLDADNADDVRAETEDLIVPVKRHSAPSIVLTHSSTDTRSSVSQRVQGFGPINRVAPSPPSKSLRTGIPVLLLVGVVDGGA